MNRVASISTPTLCSTAICVKHAATVPRHSSVAGSRAWRVLPASGAWRHATRRSRRPFSSMRPAPGPMKSRRAPDCRVAALSPCRARGLALAYAFDVAETWYFKPEGRHIMMSPADLAPTEPCDAQPDAYDIAVAIDRIESVTSMKVGR